MLEYCTESQPYDFSLVLQPFSRNSKWDFFFLIVNKFDFLIRCLDFQKHMKSLPFKIFFTDSICVKMIELKF